MSVIHEVLSGVLACDVTTFLVFICVLFVTFLSLKAMTGPKLPPGPISLPIIGSAWAIDSKKSFIEETIRLAKKYNSDIISLNLLGRQLILLQSYPVAKEAFQKRDDMVDRTSRSFFVAMDPDHKGILAASGHVWKETRRFTLSMLRDAGMGKVLSEEPITEEARQLCRRIQQKMDERGSFDPFPVLGPAVSNIICAMAFGKRFDYDDQEFIGALDSLIFMVRTMSVNFLYNLFILSPSLYRLTPYILPGTVKVMAENYQILSAFLKKVIREKREKFDGSVNDLIDGFFVEEEKQKQKKDADQFFHDAQLRFLIQDLFLAGSETTTTTLRWCLLYLAKFPDIQEKIFQELDSAIGRSRTPSMSDKKNTPYTEAFLLEVQRYKTTVPTAVGHSSSHDVEFRGYTIPAGSFILSHLGAMHRDPEVFDDPDTFKVERFLDDNNTVINADKVIQFGIGRRACAGEALARMEMYLMFTILVLSFKFESADEKFDFEGTAGPVQAPKPYNIRAFSRNDD